MSGQGGVGLTVGVDDLKGLIQPKRFYKSIRGHRKDQRAPKYDLQGNIVR